MTAAANVLIGRSLGVRGQGEVVAAMLVPMIIAYVGEIGIPVATGYLINADSQCRALIVSTARSLVLGLSIALTLTHVVLTLMLPLAPETQRLSLMFSPVILLTLLYRLHLTVIASELRLRLYNVTRIAGAATYLAILVFYWVTGTSTPLRVVCALLISNAVYCILSVPFTPRKPLLSADRPVASRILGYGLRAHVGNVPLDGLKVDQLVLALFLSTNELGLYAAAMTIVIGNRLIGVTIGTICFPLAAKRDRRNGEAHGQQFKRLLGLALAVSVIVALAEVVFAERLLTVLFGRAFEPASGALQVLAVGSVFMNLRQVCADWLRGCGRPGLVAISEALAMICLLGLAVLLWDGTIQPVAWVVSISAAISCGWLLVASVRRLS